HAERDLEQAHGEEVHPGEQTKLRRRDAELGGERRAEHRVHRAVDVRQVIARQERQDDANKWGQINISEIKGVRSTFPARRLPRPLYGNVDLTPFISGLEMLI